MPHDLFLAIETSARVGSVGLARADDLLCVRRLSADRRHTSELLPAIRDVLVENGCRLRDVGVFAYSSGPGSFTGLRVAATVARMVQSAVGCRVVAVPTLEVIARNALAPATLRPGRSPAATSGTAGRIVALLDAKRGQVYAAVYERVGHGELSTVIDARLFEPHELFAQLASPFWVVGEGIASYAQACEASGGVVLDEAYWPPSAEHVLAIARRMASQGRFCQPHEIVPLYIRPPECEEVYEQRRAAARARRGE